MQGVILILKELSGECTIYIKNIQANRIAETSLNKFSTHTQSSLAYTRELADQLTSKNSSFTSLTIFLQILQSFGLVESPFSLI